MSIFIACDSFLALRNVRNAELGTRLKQSGYTVDVFVDPNQIEGSKAAQVPDINIRPLIDFKPQPDRYWELFKWLQRMEWSRKSYGDPGTFLSKIEARMAARRAMKYFTLPYLGFGWVAGAFGFFNYCRKQATVYLRETEEYQQYVQLLKEEKPEIVIGFSPEGYREMVLMQAATDLDIPSLIMIRSRDNLVSKILFLARATEYLVWSEHQRDYFYKLYPEFKSLPVNVVGSPQFARHLQPAHRLQRDNFFQQLQLDTSRPLVVFCLENPSVVGHQQQMAQALAQVFADGKIDNHAQLLIRNHPRAFGSDYDPLCGKTYANVTVYPQPIDVPFGKHDSDIVRHILEDEAMHLATMAYQDVNVNIMSTVIVDSAIMDKPIINYGFDVPSDTPAHESVKRFFKRTDYKVVDRAGANTLVTNMDDMIAAINRGLNDKTYLADKRKSFIAEEIGVIGEESNRKIIDKILSIVNQ